MATPRTISAKYATTCSSCRGAIAPGEQIAKAGRGWGHVACAAGTPAGAQTSLIDVVAPTDPAIGDSGTAHSPTTGALEVWTDGACSGNPGPGGWAWATKDGRQGSGGEPATTNQRMEIQAALEAVLTLEGSIVVVSDSTYVVNCFRDAWWRGWLSRGWVNSAKKPVANRDLWEPLIEVVQARDITFRWVKGHSGDPMNDLVDALAVAAGKTVRA